MTKMDAVGVGHQRLDPAEAIGETAGCGPTGKMERIPGKAERDRIGKHVAGIGQQRQRPGEEAAERFGDHEAGGQAGCDQNALLIGRAMHMAGTVIVSAMVVGVRQW